MTYDLFLGVSAAAVGGSEGGGALLQVPGFAAVLRDARDGQRVDAVGIAVAVTAVLLVPAITRRPHKYGTLAVTALEICPSSQQTSFYPLFLL